MPRIPEVCPCPLCLRYGQKGAPIPGCIIGIILIGQNCPWFATGNNGGLIVFSLLPAGNYTVKPEQGGINRDKSRDAVRYANRAPTVFRGLAKGAFALAGLAVAALPTLSVNGKVSSFAALIIVSAALFLGLVGFVFQLQAHIFEIEDTK